MSIPSNQLPISPNTGNQPVKKHDEAPTPSTPAVQSVKAVVSAMGNFAFSVREMLSSTLSLRVSDDGTDQKKKANAIFNSCLGNSGKPKEFIDQTSIQTSATEEKSNPVSHSNLTPSQLLIDEPISLLNGRIEKTVMIYGFESVTQGWYGGKLGDCLGKLGISSENNASNSVGTPFTNDLGNQSFKNVLARLVLNNCRKIKKNLPKPIIPCLF